MEFLPGLLSIWLQSLCQLLTSRALNIDKINSPLSTLGPGYALIFGFNWAVSCQNSSLSLSYEKKSYGATAAPSLILVSVQGTVDLLGRRHMRIVEFRGVLMWHPPGWMDLRLGSLSLTPRRHKREWADMLRFCFHNYSMTLLTYLWV